VTASPNQDAAAEIARLGAIVAEFRRRLELSPGSLFPAHGDSLLRLGTLLADDGQTEAALAAVVEAVALFRALAEAEPFSFSVHLTSALNSLSNRLHEAGQADASHQAAEEAVLVGRKAAAGQPDHGRFVLVSALINLAGKHMRDGDAHGTVNNLAEAAEIFRNAGEAGEPFLGAMIETLHGAAMTFAEIGAWNEAVESRRLMVSVFAADPPPAVVHLLALALYQAAQAALAEGAAELANTRAAEAAGLARTLVAADPATYRLFLAQVLGNLAGCHHASGQLADGLAVALESVDLFHDSMGNDPAVGVPSLILTLENLSAILSGLGLPDQAATVDQQRAQLRASLEIMLKANQT